MTWEVTYPDAVADFQQDVALRRILLVHKASSNEDSCVKTNNESYSKECGDDSVVLSQLHQQTFFFFKQTGSAMLRSVLFSFFYLSSQRRSDPPLTPPTHPITPSANNTNMACIHGGRSAVQESHELQQLAESPLDRPTQAAVRMCEGWTVTNRKSRPVEAVCLNSLTVACVVCLYYIIKALRYNRLHLLSKSLVSNCSRLHLKYEVCMIVSGAVLMICINMFWVIRGRLSNVFNSFNWTLE